MEKSNLPIRKPNRLKNYDYGQNGAYFVTICTKDRKCLFWRKEYSHKDIEKGDIDKVLSNYGRIVRDAIMDIPVHYPTVLVEKFVVMPNHVHLLLLIQNEIAAVRFDGGRPMAAPTVSTVINQMKGYCSKRTGFSMWQKLFHDHIIRGKADYEKIYSYIDTNPMKWDIDCFYVLREEAT